ncbi:alpha-ketoglutarate-dependent dioxygenase AlkB [Cellvibrio zantedeschiae]|uniref:Alpha-ketoglutarate-dependent dioxygenase AlkB n=1 Tax=Cellvibrio zantedeschiae TaxID=1237077 RepID=A0ABQ3B9J5_9GAMM|nr:DNA oxidative demethylase AlkB [Cellvibrio zantedeschiae]GGY85271.1 alpha-ketoglutarate-dependent dioxygenase AlkB [Cellvibrio zantedeschiae]
MNFDLFSGEPQQQRQEILPGAFLLRGFALPFENELLQDIQGVIAEAPPRNMVTPGGLPMSVATTSCGDAGWVSDAYGYRYSKRDALSRKNWPAMPCSFFDLARNAATTAGYKNFSPDSALINIYKVGAKMSLHQDKNERDFSQPIVSVSLGLPATFLLGGLRREDKTIRVQLVHGDVVVWGGAARLFFHSILPIKVGVHPLLGKQRINLTFRKAL